MLPWWFSDERCSAVYAERPTCHVLTLIEGAPCRQQAADYESGSKLPHSKYFLICVNPRLNGSAGYGDPALQLVQIPLRLCGENLFPYFRAVKMRMRPVAAKKILGSQAAAAGANAPFSAATPSQFQTM